MAKKDEERIPFNYEYYDLDGTFKTKMEYVSPNFRKWLDSVLYTHIEMQEEIDSLEGLINLYRIPPEKLN